MKKKLFLLSFFILFCAQTSFATNDNYFQLGRQAYSNGDYQLAQRYFWAILNENPSNLNARYYMAHSLAKQEKYDDACVEYLRIIQADSKSETAKYAQQSLEKIEPYLSQAALHYKNEENADDKSDYFVNALSSKSQIMKWQFMPVRVYIEESPFKDIVKSAFQTWENGSKGILSFSYTTNKEKAQIEVTFKDKLENASTKKSYISGLTKPYYKGNNLIKAEITLLSTNPNSQQQLSKENVYATALHEIGHAVGIKGHSQNPSDIMYASGAGFKKTLSLRDYNTVKKVYQINPKALENYSSAIYKEKLKETTNYIKKYPDKAVGYLNLADLHRGNQEYHKAIQMYNKALTIEKNQPDPYYFLGECYFNLKNYALALSYYQQAMVRAPENKYYLNTFARACLMSNNKRLGQTYLKKYLQKYPKYKNDPVVLEVINMLK